MKRLLVAFAATAMLVACGERESDREQPAHAPSRVASQNGEAVVTLDEATQQRTGLSVSSLQAARVPAEVRAYGTVLDVQALAELARNYAAARARVHAAQAKLQASKAAFERARTLHHEEENISTAQLQAAEAAYRSDEAALSAAESEARTVGAGAEQAWGPVIGRGIAETSPLVMRLIERKDVLLQVTLPPGAAAEPAETAVAEVPGARAVKATLISRSPRTDPNIQGPSYLYGAPAESGLLPGMNVLVRLPSGKPLSGSIVPASAVVWWQGKPWIYLRKDARTFVRRDLAILQTTPDGGYVVSNIAPDTAVVVQGAQMLLSEALRSQAAESAGEGK